ncbi:hypothetical protein BB558_007261 [Smittium angustum]|uniref:Uncharacterized protein n=1 Tax=Smittium angustum TaxID=133377 RepID=A0A2U1IVH6_SMIAN|nr:hypothetical protein BB558_007261 [Smittium angustum]
MFENLKKSWSKICCPNGKYIPPVWKMPTEETPQFQIHKHSKNNGAQGNLLKKFSCQLNNALTLASQIVNKTCPIPGYNPSKIIQGKLYHVLSSLQANENETPRYVQISEMLKVDVIFKQNFLLIKEDKRFF